MHNNEIPKVKEEEMDQDEIQIIENEAETDAGVTTSAGVTEDVDMSGDTNNANENTEMTGENEQIGEEEEECGDYEVDLACDANGLIDADVQDQQTEENNSKTTTTTTAKAGGTEQKKADIKSRPKLSRYEREKIYKLPSTPHIIVHPSATAKGAKFNCHVATLSTLLDYTKVNIGSG